jgi:hypothetical protein
MEGTLDYLRVDESTQFILTLGADDRDPAGSPHALAVSGAAKPLPTINDAGMFRAVSP